VLAAVGDGVSGIELALKLEPDIVLLDMRMPDMDGIGVLKQYRQDLPVVMLTTSTSNRICSTR
jgi:CheY-like chemotaxis protein